MSDHINWDNVIAALQVHCENQRDAMRDSARVEATGDIVAVFFDIDRVRLATATLGIVTSTSVQKQSWGYQLYEWIKEVKAEE